MIFYPPQSAQYELNFLQMEYLRALRVNEATCDLLQKILSSDSKMFHLHITESQLYGNLIRLYMYKTLEPEVEASLILLGFRARHQSKEFPEIWDIIV